MNFVSRLVPTRIEPIGRLVVSLGGLERITSNFLAPSRPTKFTQVRNGVHSDAKTVRLLLLLILIDVCLHGLLASPHRTSHSSGAMLGNYAQTCLIFHKPAVFQHTPKICHHSFSSPSNQHGRRRPWDSLPESIDRRSPIPNPNGGREVPLTGVNVKFPKTCPEINENTKVLGRCLPALAASDGSRRALLATSLATIDLALPK